MGYYLKPNNADINGFELGAFSWPILLEAFGYLFPEIHYRGKYIVLRGIDERHETAELGDNGGFPVTADEARIMARMARNFVAIQDELETQPQADLLTPAALEPWPRKIRDDFVEKFAKFADWAEQSGGFEVR